MNDKMLVITSFESVHAAVSGYYTGVTVEGVGIHQNLKMRQFGTRAKALLDYWDTGDIGAWIWTSSHRNLERAFASAWSYSLFPYKSPQTLSSCFFFPTVLAPHGLIIPSEHPGFPSTSTKKDCNRSRGPLPLYLSDSYPFCPRLFFGYLHTLSRILLRTVAPAFLGYLRLR